jgi:hypothetical protein
VEAKKVTGTRVDRMRSEKFLNSRVLYSGSVRNEIVRIATAELPDQTREAGTSPMIVGVFA